MKTTKTIKADDKVHYEGIDEEEKYTEFELLQARFDALEEEFKTVCLVLKQHNLSYKTKEFADGDTTDGAFMSLEEKYGEDDE